MKALIVDDTRLARQELQFLLQNHKEVDVIGEAENADEAKSMIEELKPDLVFLDIQMPDKDGFELLEMLDEVPQIIFTTAYSEYAIKAFDYNALDYLKKPITDDRLSVALQRVIENIEKSEEPKDVLNENSQVFVKDGEKCWFVTLKDVRLFEIWDNYTRIYFDEHKPMIPKTLQYMESRLDPKMFFRANRQQIINMKWIDKIEPWFSGTIRLYLKDGTEIEVSRRQTSRFKDLMSF
ncbi:LytR/AlgR family response regulator transcription factor [Ekhidna sp.]